MCVPVDLKSPQAGATGRCEVALPLGTPGAPEGIEPELASRVVVLEYKKNNQSLLFQTNGLSSMRSTAPAHGLQAIRAAGRIDLIFILNIPTVACSSTGENKKRGQDAMVPFSF